MPDTIDDLRSELFATLRDLRNPDKPFDIERARAVSDIAQTIINSAKAEVDLVKATGKITASTFIPMDRPAPKAVHMPSRPYDGSMAVMPTGPRSSI